MVANLRDLTDKGALEQAAQEFLDLGRDEFLSKYGLEKSRDYFVLHEGKLIDSKPLLSVAFGKQFPEIGSLAVSEFSGGTGGAVRALARLDQKVVTRAQLSPPAIGVPYASRTDIYEDFGGDKVAGIMRFPGESVVNVFSDADGPYADDPPTLTDPFGYRGEGLNGPQRLDVGGNALLDRARIEQTAVRFWYRPQGESFAFVSWAAVLGRAWVSGVGQDKVPRPEIEWQLQATVVPLAAAWPVEVRQAVADFQESGADTPTDPEALATSTYLDLVNRVEQRGQPKRPNGVVRSDYPRSVAARRAVLLRSEGKCESTRCTGMPAEKNRQGQPILDVDHIVDLALGGLDHPQNMVALCPNCHASKTRGLNRARWRAELMKVATAAHNASIGK